MQRFLKKLRDMLVRDYITWVIEINNYLEEFLPTIVGRNATKLPDNEILDLLEFGIPIKWQRQMQAQNFEPTAGTLRDFQNFCERLESALDDPVTDDKSNKMCGQEKGSKNSVGTTKMKEKHFCMLHGHNPTHSTKMCRTLKKGAEKHQKTCENGKQKNSKRAYKPTKEEIHVLTAFAKDAMKK